MTNEQLLIPRYKVIADYPNRPATMPIGHILTLNEFGAGKWWHKHTEEEPIHIDEGFDKFPNIFRQLKWWEERNDAELPKYLKCYSPDGKVDFVLKVERYIMHKEVDVIWAFEYFWKDEKDIKRMSMSEWFPATKEEYLCSHI